ncbi:hypothetical protein NF681_20330 (plasmid) [Comamonadaceae bacterium OTU4NAUVB1]|nr:hypothetical protein NF681_20330 [Comamonadaceae bacterium OTU4NAUVB1]
MSKKQDFLRSEQSRDRHPERDQVGSPAAGARATPQDTQDTPAASHGGKVANAHNQVGDQAPTQTNQGRRTPESRHDRQTLGAGPQNQVSARKGGGGAGRTPRGAG